MRKAIFLVGVILLAANASRAQDVPSAEVSASYSFFRLGFSNGLNQNGVSFSAAGNLNHWLGIAGDFGGYHASPAGVGVTTYTYLGGPRFSYRQSRNVTPFAQVLFGGARGTASVLGVSVSANGFAYSTGAGVDLGISNHLALRPQFDYIGMRISGQTVNTARVSFGIVFRFDHH